MNMTYVLITPARNEEKYIEGVIRSVSAQTVLPRKWVIVSDGSTDRTDDIVQDYAGSHEFIRFTRMPEHRDRSFAAKVACFNAGYALLNGLEYDILGNLDADITFEPDYFEYLLNRFAENPKLGVGGTPFVEKGQHYDYRFTNIEHVSGACQMFRRQCFESIGGYKPIAGGGIDWVAVTTARMTGWETRTFVEKTCVHHRKIGTGTVGPSMLSFKQGRKDYFLGNHPLWEIFRAFYQMTRKPHVIGGGFLLLGYSFAALQKTPVPISKELVDFIRGEQLQRLKKCFRLA